MREEAAPSVLVNQPWLCPYADVLSALPEAWDGIAAPWALGKPGACADALNALRRVWLEGASEPVLCPQFEFCGHNLKALAFEAQVASGRIPTRDCWHDWFHGLVWLRFPRFKQALNQAHLNEALSGKVEVGEGQRAGNGRSRLRDALTLLDECGLVLVGDEAALVDALRNHAWPEALIAHRESWGRTLHPVLLGHGLMESLMNPHKALCAKVWHIKSKGLLPLGSSSGGAKGFGPVDWRALDAQLAVCLNTLYSPRDLSPLPVLGVPGWWAPNEYASFYEDPAVFRAKPTGLSPE